MACAFCSSVKTRGVKDVLMRWRIRLAGRHRLLAGSGTTSQQGDMRIPAGLRHAVMRLEPITLPHSCTPPLKDARGWRAPTLNATYLSVLQELHHTSAKLGFAQPTHFVFPWHGRNKQLDPTKAMTSRRSA
jgi:hypothetical protein